MVVFSQFMMFFVVNSRNGENFHPPKRYILTVRVPFVTFLIVGQRDFFSSILLLPIFLNKLALSQEILMGYFQKMVSAGRYQNNSYQHL